MDLIFGVLCISLLAGETDKEGALQILAPWRGCDNDDGNVDDTKTDLDKPAMIELVTKCT